jgi:hypothetical protein
MAKKIVNKKPDNTFQLIKAIRGVKQKNNEGEASLYKANVNRRDASVRKYIDENVSSKSKDKIFGLIICLYIIIYL